MYVGCWFYTWLIPSIVLVCRSTWALFFVYGHNFGVELTMDNIIVPYLYDQFALSLTMSGVLGAIFGLMNIFSRASGGMLSDLSAKYSGMPSRLWCLFILQMLGGASCIAMSQCSSSFGLTILFMILFGIFAEQVGPHNLV